MRTDSSCQVPGYIINSNKNGNRKRKSESESDGAINNNSHNNVEVGSGFFKR